LTEKWRNPCEVGGLIELTLKLRIAQHQNPEFGHTQKRESFSKKNLQKKEGTLAFNGG
jgi:hypothetical protein